MKKLSERGAWPRSHDLFFQISGPPNISGTPEDTNLKFCTLIGGKGPYSKQKCKTSQNRAWLRSHATSRSRDIFNIQATEALKNSKIRESIAFDFQHGYQMWTWFGYLLHQKKAKINFKN